LRFTTRASGVFASVTSVSTSFGASIADAEDVADEDVATDEEVVAAALADALDTVDELEVVEDGSRQASGASATRARTESHPAEDMRVIIGVGARSLTRTRAQMWIGLT
jgi:hypothetical protein